MTASPHEPFPQVPTLLTARLRLEPLGPQHLAGTWAALSDEEGMRLTGTTARFSEDQIRDWLGGLADRHDRADWAIVVRDTGEHVGEAVLNEWDPESRAMNFRIALASGSVRGLGYGTEATRAVVDHGLDVVGLHRIALEVFDFNPGARRVYEKAGFVFEGVRRDTLELDGVWHSSVLMSILESDPRPAAAG